MRTATFLAKAAVSIGLLVLALRAVDLDQVWVRLSDFHAGWGAVALSVFVCQFLVATWRWRRVITALGCDVSYGVAFRAGALGVFFNQALPSSIGGDVVRVWMLRQYCRDWRLATHAVFIDRVAGVLALAALLALCAPAAIQLADGAVAFQAAFLLAMGLGLACGALFAFGALRRVRQLSWRPAVELRALSDAARSVLLSRREAAVIHAGSLVVHALTLVAGYALILGLEAPIGAIAMAVALPAVLVATMVPVSVAGWGVREGAMIVALGLVGAAEADALAFSLLFGVFMLATGALGGLAWFWRSPGETVRPPA